MRDDSVRRLRVKDFLQDTYGGDWTIRELDGRSDSISCKGVFTDPDTKKSDAKICRQRLLKELPEKRFVKPLTSDVVFTISFDDMEKGMARRKDMLDDMEHVAQYLNSGGLLWQVTRVKGDHEQYDYECKSLPALSAEVLKRHKDLTMDFRELAEFFPNLTVPFVRYETVQENVPREEKRASLSFRIPAFQMQTLSQQFDPDPEPSAATDPAPTRLWQRIVRPVNLKDPNDPKRKITFNDLLQDSTAVGQALQRRYRGTWTLEFPPSKTTRKDNIEDRGNYWITVRGSFLNLPETLAFSTLDDLKSKGMRPQPFSKKKGEIKFKVTPESLLEFIQQDVSTNVARGVS